MKRALLLVCLISAAACAARGDIPFYTENWSWLNGNWRVDDGSPVANYKLYDSPVGATRVVYTGSVPVPDYSIQTDVIAGNGMTIHHYLRVSASPGWDHYRVDFETAGWGWVRIRRMSGYGGVILAEVTGISCNGTVKSSVNGSTITAYVNGTPIISTVDTTYSSGQPGVGTWTWGTPSDGGAIGATVLATVDTQPPTVPTGLAAVPYATHVNLSWTASTDNVGVQGYKVYRGGDYIGWTTTTSYTDAAVDPVTNYSYTVLACDAAGNQSAQSAALPVTTLPLSYSAPEAGGPVEYAATWGAGPEKIALLTGALSVRVPLLKLQQRSRGPGFQMMAAWNSQFWSWDAAGTKMAAIDVGYGLGFMFQIGAVYPVYSGSTLVRYEFQDAAGVIHKLEATGTAHKYKSQDSTYLLWDDSARTLTFTDGAVWFFDCVSRYPEPDAGSRYPTRLRDRNGNLIDITYAAASAPLGTNTTARITEIRDTLTKYTWTYGTIGGKPHVSTVYHWQSSGQGFNDAIFTYDTVTNIVSPFGSGKELSGQPLTRVRLKQISFTGAVSPFKFDYNDSAEITKITFPYKGYFRYVYTTAQFSNDTREVREIGARYMNDNTASGEQLYEFSHPSGDTSLPQHTETTLTDPPGNKKVWQFIQGSSNGWDNGLQSRYEAWQGPSSSWVLKQAADATWTQDNPSSQSLTNPRVSSTTGTSAEGGVSVQSKVERDVDGNGNTTQVREYAYGNLSTPARTTTTSYVSASGYTSRNILNLPSQVTICAGASGCGSPASSTAISYDQTAVADVSGITQHDTENYGTGFWYRGNPTTINANGFSVTQTYDIGGNLLTTKDPQNHTVSSVNYLATTGQVSSATSGADSTSLAWNADTTLQSRTGSNNESVGFTYSSYRPTAVGYPDGTHTTFSYQDTANPVTETETSQLGRVTVRTRDGFGRVIKTAVRESTSPEVWISTETQYSACSCSSTGKAVKQSRPYRTGDTPVWTESQFDALGRPTAVILPDSHQTTYAYSVENGADWKGTVTTITDPLSKQCSASAEIGVSVR